MSAQLTEVYRSAFGDQRHLDEILVNWWKPVGHLA